MFKMQFLLFSRKFFAKSSSRALALLIAALYSSYFFSLLPSPAMHAMAASSSALKDAGGPDGRASEKKEHKYRLDQVLRMPWPGPRMTTFPPVGQANDWQSTLQAAEDIGLAPSLAGPKFCHI